MAIALQDTLLGRPLLSYALVAVAVAAALALRLVLLVVLRRRAGKGGEGEASRRSAMLDLAIRRLIIPSLYVGTLAAALSILDVGEPARKIASEALVGLIVFFSARLLNSAMSLYVQKYARRGGSLDRIERFRPILGSVKAVLWLGAGLFYLDNIGIRTSSVLAGLGIGGIAVALAAQSILGDLFSYFIIYFDRPFEVGDYIVFDEYSGTVEAIGIKTTKIRSLSGEQIVAANSVLTSSRIRNYKRMERRRVAFSISVAYGTSDELLGKVPGIVREAVSAQPLATFDRSHLKGMGPSSLEFESVYHVNSADYDAYMDIQQAIIRRLLSELEALGVELAFPTSTVRIVGDGGSDRLPSGD